LKETAKGEETSEKQKKNTKRIYTESNIKASPTDRINGEEKKKTNRKKKRGQQQKFTNTEIHTR